VFSRLVFSCYVLLVLFILSQRTAWVSLRSTRPTGGHGVPPYFMLNPDNLRSSAFPSIPQFLSQTACAEPAKPTLSGSIWASILQMRDFSVLLESADMATPS